MNTSGLPFANSPHGTTLAIGLGVAAAAFTYWLLRRLGIIRRR